MEFRNCTNLVDVDLWNFTTCSTGSNYQAFNGCGIQVVKLPNMTIVPNYALRNPVVVYGDKVVKIGRYCINSSASGRRIVIMSTTPPTMISGTQITNPTAGVRIYVPDVEVYKASTAFSGIASFLHPISEYPDAEDLGFD